jgi:biotin carboxyl carrier protein
VNGRARVRVTVSGPAPLVVQLDGVQVAALTAAQAAEIVSPLPGTGADSAFGRRSYEVVVDGWRFIVSVEPAARAALRERAARAADEHHAEARITLRAQIPGRVVRLWVEQGEAVEQGQRLLAIEAMKMENEVRAHRDGVVRQLPVSAGEAVNTGQVICIVEGE